MPNETEVKNELPNEEISTPAPVEIPTPAPEHEHKHESFIEKIVEEVKEFIGTDFPLSGGETDDELR